MKSVWTEVLRHVGLGPPREDASAEDERRARLAQRLAPRKERSAISAQAREDAIDLGPPPEGVVPAPAPLAAVTTRDGVGFTADGHLADPEQWTRDLALSLAEAQGVALDDARWKVIEFARADFEEHGASPNVRRITMGTGLATRELYAMFPDAPARTVAKIAGIPKPAGCI